MDPVSSGQAGLGAAGAALGAIANFVQAIDPAAVEIMQEAMRNISATIGQALVPIVETMTEVFREANDIIAPLFEELAPLIAAVEIFRAAIAIFTALIQLIASLFGQTFKDVIKGFRDTIREATRAVILFAARIAKFFGLDSVVENLKKTFSGEKATGAKTTPRDFGISGLEDIIRAQTVEAARAGQGGAGAQTAEDFLKGIDKQIGSILTNQGTLGELLRGLFKDLPAQIAKGIEGLPGAIARAIRGSAKAVTGVVSKAVKWLSDF